MTEARRASTLLPVLLAAGLALSACDDQEAARQAHANTGAPAPEVGVVIVAPRPVAITTELSGRTTAYQVAEVRPQVSGLIQQRLFREGAEVAAGDPLYQIDPASYRATYNNAKALLQSANASVATAKSKAKRYDELVQINAVSAQDRDDAEAALKEAEADVAANEAALQTARINLDRTSLTAPISGRIGRSSVTAGALVTENQTTALATIQQLDPIYVDVTQSSGDLLRMKRALADGRLTRDNPDKAKVTLTLEDGSAYPLTGTLEFSEVSVDESTGMVTLRAVFPNPDENLLPGMFVRAIVQGGTDNHAILVPQQGVTRNARGIPTALVVNDDGKVEQRELKVSQAVGTNWLVTEGLKAGDRLIVEGSQKARPGASVQTVEVELGGDGAKAGGAAAPKS
ncbi:MAG: efflux RND transporter periplasmic adaptor subunit [Kiloniellaceae bacterium]